MQALISQLVEARRSGTRIAALEAGFASVDAGHDVQDQVAASLGEAIGGFKANAPPGEPPIRGLIFARTIYQSPAQIPASLVLDLTVEGEIAFRFLKNLPARETDYTREEISRAVLALPAIEVLSGRLLDWANRPQAEQLADCLNNGALVTGADIARWQHLELANLPVCAFVNGEKRLDRIGGHPTGDPLGVAVALANIERRRAGVTAGQIVTTGGCTGVWQLQPGDRFAVAFEGIGRVELLFEPG